MQEKEPQYVNSIIRAFTQPLSQLAQAFQQLQSAGAASSRVFEFLGEEEMQDESNKKAIITNTKGDVEFSHVRFGYEPDKIIINDFSAKAKSGQKIAIVGPTGAGKTTLVNLLMRFYEINSGEIKIDGVSTADIKREDVHSKFCMVLQDTWLKSGTIRENILLGKHDATDAEIQKALEMAYLDEFVSTLAEGLDTQIGERGILLSGGQKQRVAIARAFIKNAPVVILDEATSALDNKSEAIVQKAIDNLMIDKTVFVIAHRLSTIQNADRIAVINEGVLAELGTHDELMQLEHGKYKTLYEMQFRSQKTPAAV